MLPALSRSFFRASVNGKDVAAAEVRYRLNSAWLSPASEIFGSPFDRANVLGVGSPDADGAEAISNGGGDGGEAQQVQVQVRSWDVARDLLKMHVLACKVRAERWVIQTGGSDMRNTRVCRSPFFVGE